MSSISSKNIKRLSVPQSPVVLAILDGWGYRKEISDNAINSANTPIMDSLWHAYPHTLISASGSDVGLPDGQMGKSEVGHLTIGSGRIIPFLSLRSEQFLLSGYQSIEGYPVFLLFR